MKSSSLTYPIISSISIKSSTIRRATVSTLGNDNTINDLPLHEIPGSYGIPFFQPIKDRLEYFYSGGPDEFFRSRVDKHQSTVFRANMPPGPFIRNDSKVIVLLDAKSFPVLFDVSKVEKKDVFTGTYMPSTDDYLFISTVDLLQDLVTTFISITWISTREEQANPLGLYKYEYEKRKKEKLEEVKARLDFGDARKKSTRAQESANSKSRTVSPRRRRRSRSPRHNPSVFTRLRRERSRSPRHEYKNKERRESTVFKRLGSRGRSTSAHSDSRQESSRYMKNYSKNEDSEGGHWKSKLRRKKSIVEDDDLSQPWVCAETDPFTSRIRHFDFPKTRMPSHVKTYNESEDPEDHLKIFQAAAKTERWAMPTWCHMFNSTLTGNARVWFDDLPPESIDSYNDLREAFLKNYLQQKKCIKDPIVLHNIKQRDGESTEDFIQRYKLESKNVKGAPECMRISGFVHEITNLELIKRFHEKIPKTVDEMMQVATSFLQGQEAASNQERKKVPQAWRHQEGSHRQNFKKGGGFRSQHKMEKRPDRFTLLTKTPKEILALEKGKFKTPPPMTTPVEKRNANKFCEFHGEVGHNTDECNHLRKQIEDMLKAGKLSHIIRELKQNSGKEQPKKKGETSGKEKPQAILMIQSRQNAVRQKITQSFSPDLEISFPSLGNDEGAEGPLIIEAEVGGHQVHRMCIDGGSSFEILYEHCFNRLRPEIRNQMVPATTSLVGFSGEIKWPLGQITLLVKVGDDEHSTSAWMDFMVVRSTSPCRHLHTTKSLEGPGYERYEQYHLQRTE
ncbi:reverse transcriptase domain-containing protein [Tanacetum coccineum]|uniref:Reverse transcriptase domain-containing protein n=1 Tax=Tanacetum coccineum TaxID=301880 RepID=A0ABQ5F441_9ASTR